MNRRSFFRSLLGTPLAVPAIAALTSATGAMTCEGGAEAVMPLKRGPQVNITIHGDPRTFRYSDLFTIRDGLRRQFEQADRAR